MNAIGLGFYLVAIKDKDLDGEPYIAFAVVAADSESAAVAKANPTVDQLIEAGRGRCHAVVVRQIQHDLFYRTTMLRLPADHVLVAENERLMQKLADFETRLDDAQRMLVLAIQQLPQTPTTRQLLNELIR